MYTDNHMTKHDSETPAHGEQVITACAFIHHSFNGVKKVFLPKRAATKKFLPNVYELPGGHIDFGENLKDGLKREITEEFCMRVNIGDTLSAFTYMNDVKKSHSIEVIFFATFIDPINRVKLDPDDHSEYGWFSENDLDDVVSDVKGRDDPEIIALNKGFQLLKGSTSDFGDDD